MTKELLLSAGIICAILNQTQAQTQKGNGILGGGVSLGHYQSRGGQTSSKYTGIPVSLNITVGKFVADNWMLGFEGGYTGQFNRQYPQNGQVFNSRDSQNDMSISPFVRRYFSTGPVLLFAGTGIRLRYNQIKGLTENNGFTNSSLQKGYSVNSEFMAGVNYPLSNRLSVQGLISSSIFPLSASAIGLGIIYWTGPNGTGATNQETTLTTTQQGNWVVEGGVTVSGNDYNITNSQRPTLGRKSAATTLNASVSNFIANNLLLGIGFGFYALNTNTTGNATTDPNQRTYFVSPYVQRYYGSRRLRPYVHGAVSFNSERIVGQETVTPIEVNLGVGLAYLISNRFLVETSLGNASYSFVDNGNDNRNRSINLSAQLSSGFSLRYVIAGRK